MQNLNDTEESIKSRRNVISRGAEGNHARR